MQKIIIIALLCACAFATQVNVSVGTATGFGVTMGVAHKCHQSCLTCKGGKSTDCLSCEPTFTLATGSCACTGTDKVSGTATPTVICEATGANTATLAICAGITQGFGAGNLWHDTDKCTYCPDTFKTCTSATVATTICWATQALTGTTCTYAAAKSYVSGLDTVFIQTGVALSIVNGYWYNATGHVQMPCNAGCLTCTPAATPAVLCSTCAPNYSLVGTTKLACECKAAGFFTTAASATSLGACTACGTGCTTCSSATVCTVCDSSHSLGATTASSSTCESMAVVVTTSATATATTDGESSMTSTTGTDAATTNGVLITAASVLLAVILA